MKKLCLLICLALGISAVAQTPVNISKYNSTGAAKVSVKGNLLTVKWPAGKSMDAQLLIDLDKSKPLFKSIKLSSNGIEKEVAANLDPTFVLTVGKRTLDPSSGGWDVFFDKVPTRPFKAYPVEFNKRDASVSSVGSRTVIRIGEVHAASFTGALEITVYNGSPLFNIAAVMATQVDSTAMVYDAGLVSKAKAWDKISWSDTEGTMQSAATVQSDTAKNVEVKYRTIIGGTKGGSLAVFPAPHQYFYPLDEAFNLKFTWYGNNYRGIIPNYGLGIRQELQGDHRYVPWFNARPKAQNRLNFFCLISTDNAGSTLSTVKKFTHNDVYPAIPGYKTMQSHFHNEYTMSVVLAGKPVVEEPNFVKVFKGMGVNIVHLAEFHGPGHPKGPDATRLNELKTLFAQCSRLSKDDFLLLPGEEVNNFYGGHWLAIFPKPVYWVMSRKAGVPFETEDPALGKVYHVGDKDDMFKILQLENGLSWTAHARTKASVGFPDTYKDEAFYRSDHFMGGAWKNIPADLSLPTLSRRVLNLMDETNNWGLKKHYIGECDIFSMEPENETYAHVNVNYMQLDKLPAYKDGWQPVLDKMAAGKFFTTTGEILFPSFLVNGKGAGETVTLTADGKTTVKVTVNWTYPLNFIDIISGDGKNVYHKRIDQQNTEAFGKKVFTIPVDLKGRTWVRLEAWDAAVNGAFTQTVWLKK
jgi:hypothetical protein